jgi:hypothetical protein
MSKKREDSFQIGPPLPDGIWELTPRPGDTLDELKIEIFREKENPLPATKPARKRRSFRFRRSHPESPPQEESPGEAKQSGP